jgi:hypothetical protein
MMFGRFVRRRGNQSGCAAEQKGLHQTKRKEKKRKTTQSKLMRSDVLTQTFSPHELTFAFLATAKAYRSPGATTQGRAQMSIWISGECACLPACLHASGNYAKKSTKRLLHPPPKPTSKQGTTLHVRE